jgi:hypothetical protein
MSTRGHGIYVPQTHGQSSRANSRDVERYSGIDNVSNCKASDVTRRFYSTSSASLLIKYIVQLQSARLAASRRTADVAASYIMFAPHAIFWSDLACFGCHGFQLWVRSLSASVLG